MRNLGVPRRQMKFYIVHVTDITLANLDSLLLSSDRPFVPSKVMQNQILIQKKQHNSQSSNKLNHLWSRSNDSLMAAQRPMTSSSELCA